MRGRPKRMTAGSAVFVERAPMFGTLGRPIIPGRSFVHVIFLFSGDNVDELLNPATRIGNFETTADTANLPARMRI